MPEDLLDSSRLIWEILLGLPGITQMQPNNLVKDSLQPNNLVKDSLNLEEAPPSIPIHPVNGNDNDQPHDAADDGLALLVEEVIQNNQ